MTAASSRKWLMYTAAVILIGFLVLPLLIIVPMSLTSGTSLAFPPPELSLRWYRELLDDPRWLASFFTSVTIAAAATTLSCLLGVPAAIGLAWGRFPGKRLIYAVVAAPLVVPTVIVAVASFYFFSGLGLVGNRWSIILVHTAMAVPVVLTTVVASLAGFDRTLMRAAASLGASNLRAFFHVLLPLIAPGVVTGAIIAFIISFDEIVVASFLSTAGDRTLPRMIFSGVRESVSPAIASVAVLLIVFSAILLAMIGWLQSRSGRLRKPVQP